MTTRITVLMALLQASLSIGTPAAQSAKPAPPRDAVPTVADERTARETREHLHEVLDQYRRRLRKCYGWTRRC
jgi:hypothetical protein